MEMLFSDDRGDPCDRNDPCVWIVRDRLEFYFGRSIRKDRFLRFKFLEATETITWKHSSPTTEAILAIETILAYGSSEIDSSSISDDPYARIVSIARIASVF